MNDGVGDRDNLRRGVGGHETVEIIFYGPPLETILPVNFPPRVTLQVSPDALRSPNDVAERTEGLRADGRTINTIRNGAAGTGTHIERSGNADHADRVVNPKRAGLDEPE